MGVEAGHVQITEFSKEVLPQINWMMEDLFCRYGVTIPYFLLEFDFPDYSERPDWCSGYNFNLDWGPWGYYLPWFNELLGLIWDEAHLPRLTLPDLSPINMVFFNEYINILYDNLQTHYVYDQSGTFIKDEVIEGETSEITAWYKWIDDDGYIHIANKRDADGEPVADFQDEKIVGQTSGAYAWTYQIVEEEFLVTDEDPSLVVKYGYSCMPYGTAAAAWDMYDDSPEYETAHLAYCNFGCGYGYPSQCVSAGYKAIGNKFYFKFDTSGASANPQTATLTFTCKARNNTGLDNPTLRLYSQDYGDEVDTEDWGNGTLVDSYLLDVGNVWPLETVDVSFSVDTEYVTVGGWSKFKLNFKEVDDGTHPTTATGFACQNITSIKLTLAY